MDGRKPRCLREDSAYRKVKWTKNVHGFPSEKPEVISLEKLHTKVYGCSYEHPEVTEAIYSSIRPEDQPGIHILLAYGGDETHIPMKKEDGAGFDYVALGYRHIPGVLVENQMAYAGSPEPIRLEETGTHGVVYGEITEDEQGQYHTQITLVPCACRSYILLSLRIHSGTTQAAPGSRKYRMRSHRKEAKISTGSGSRDIGIRNWSLNWRHCAPMEIL